MDRKKHLRKHYPDRGSNPRGVNWAKLSWKLHQNEENWKQQGRVHILLCRSATVSSLYRLFIKSLKPKRVNQILRQAQHYLPSVMWCGKVIFWVVSLCSQSEFTIWLLRMTCSNLVTTPLPPHPPQQLLACLSLALHPYGPFQTLYLSRFVSVGDALGREWPATPMSSYFAGRSTCTVT